MKMLLALSCAVALFLGVAGIAKAVPIEFTDVWHPTTSEPAIILKLLGLSLIGLAGFGKKLKMKATPQDNGGRRSGFERREFSYTFYSPERRSGKDRRSGRDRRKSKRT